MRSLVAAGEKATVTLLAPQLQHLEWAARSEISAEDALSVLDASRRLAGGRPYAILVDMTDIVDLPPSARAVFNAETSVLAAALLGHGPMDEVLAAGACKAVHPTRYFTSRSEALAWLQDSLVRASGGPGPDRRG